MDDFFLFKFFSVFFWGAGDLVDLLASIISYLKLRLVVSWKIHGRFVKWVACFVKG